MLWRVENGSRYYDCECPTPTDPTLQGRQKRPWLCLARQLSAMEKDRDDERGRADQMSVNFDYVWSLVEYIANSNGVEPGTWQSRVEAVRDIASGKVEGPLMTRFKAALAERDELRAAVKKLLLMWPQGDETANIPPYLIKELCKLVGVPEIESPKGDRQ